MYTVMVAGMGRRVVAIDAMADNLAYIRHSLVYSGKEHLVTLLHNAIRWVHTWENNFQSYFDSNTHDTLYPTSLNSLDTHHGLPRS